MFKYIKKCSTNSLNETDLFKIKTEDSSEHLSKLLQSNWNEEIKRAEKTRPSLLRVLVISFWWEYFKINVSLLTVQLMILR